MNGLSLVVGALLLVAPPAVKLPAQGDPRVTASGVEWLSLRETMEAVRRQLGPPTLVAEYAAGLVTWQYQLGDIDHHDYSHILVFRKADQALLSVTRNYEPERTVDALFPAAETKAYAVPGQAGFVMRTRALPGGRMLLAMARSGAGQPVGQLVLMRASEVGRFYPWLASLLAAGGVHTAG